MRVQIRDRDALAGLALGDVRAYLLSHGWPARGQYGSVATIYVTAGSNHNEHEILLPARENLGDHPARMGDIVGTPADVAGRSQLSVFADLAGPGRHRDAKATPERADR
jgi:hypothetical protein